MDPQSSQPHSHSKTWTTLNHNGQCDKSCPCCRAKNERSDPSERELDGKRSDPSERDLECLICRSQKKTYKNYSNSNIPYKMSDAAKRDLDSIFFE